MTLPANSLGLVSRASIGLRNACFLGVGLVVVAPVAAAQLGPVGPLNDVLQCPPSYSLSQCTHLSLDRFVGCPESQAFASCAMDSLDRNTGCAAVGPTTCFEIETAGVLQSFVLVTPARPVDSPAAFIDQYAVPLATGGIVHLPCVVVVVPGAEANPCADLGGAFESRLVQLGSGPDGDVVVYNALLTVRVKQGLPGAGSGLEDFPILVADVR